MKDDKSSADYWHYGTGWILFSRISSLQGIQGFWPSTTQQQRQSRADIPYRERRHSAFWRFARSDLPGQRDTAEPAGRGLQSCRAVVCGDIVEPARVDRPVYGS